MNILGFLARWIFGRNMAGGGSRVMIIAMLGVGWVMGDRYGVPEPVQGLVDQAIESTSGMIGGLLSGDEGSE